MLACLARSSFYYYIKEIAKPDKYAEIKFQLRELHESHKKRLGYREMTREIRDLGYTINHKTVYKLMKLEGLRCKVRRKKYNSYKGDVGKIAPNILNREFTACEPLTKLVTDITEFKVQDTKIYLSPIMDLYNREILSYSISLSPNMAQIKEMLGELFNKLPQNMVALLHSDQGWQYQQKSYREALKENNIVQSMSRKATCLDNACIENFFGQLKCEMFYGEKFESVNIFIKKLKEYIYYHNNIRKSGKTKGLTPVNYRIQSLSA